MSKIKLLMVFISVSLFFGSCWPEDDTIESFPSKTLSNSVYNYQIYYSLTHDSILKVNAIDAWDLGFENSKSGCRIIVNSGKQLAVANMGKIDINSIITIPTNTNWIYDASSGNPDSAAIINWIDTSNNPYIFSNNVYILGINGDYGYEAKKKMKFIDCNDTSYTMLLANIESTLSDTVIIPKNGQVSFTKVSVIETFAIEDIEPDKFQWDLLFTQYGTILYTDAGIPVPYIVRGVLINPGCVTVAKVKTTYENDFYQLDSSFAKKLDYSDTWDIIGYDWKDVIIDENTNSAVYTTLPNKVYFIRFSNGIIYKLRFIDYYNSKGEPGFISFEYYQL
jgi:hypothetical protein